MTASAGRPEKVRSNVLQPGDLCGINYAPRSRGSITRRCAVMTYVPSGMSEQPRLERKMKILVVEDHAPTRMAISRLIRQAGAEVITARDGEEALGYLLTQHFDVL